MGRSKIVASFLGSIEQIQQIGDSSDIALTMMALDCIEQNVSVMQEYLNDASETEIYDDMPVGNVIRAIMSVLEIDSLLMTGRMQELAKTKAYLDNVITMLQAGKK